MALKWAARSLTKSVLAGGAAAASVAVVMAAGMTASSVEGWNDAAQLARLLAGLAAISFAIVLAGVLLIGLPTTFVLRRLGKESEGAYVTAGAAFGFAVPIAALLFGNADGGYWLAILGAAAGGVAGRVWWRTYRLKAVEPADL